MNTLQYIFTSKYLYIIISIIFGVYIIYGNGVDLGREAPVEIINKKNVIKKEEYIPYENKTLIKRNILIGSEFIPIIKGIHNIDSNIDIENLKNNYVYKAYIKENYLGVNLIKYLQNVKKLYIDDISYQSILNLHDLNYKLKNPIKNNSVFEIPLNSSKVHVSNEKSYTHKNILLDKDNDIVVKFNFKENTISLKSKNKNKQESLKVFYNGRIKLQELIGGYIFSTLYYYSDISKKGYIMLKRIDTNNNIGYHLISVDFQEDESIISVYMNTKLISSSLKLSRKNCKITNVKKEYLYFTDNGKLSIYCINNNEEIYNDIIYF